MILLRNNKHLQSYICHVSFLTAITKKLFLEGRLGTSICLHPIWDFFLYFLVPWNPRSDGVEIGLLINVFAEFWSHVMFWRFVICLGARWFGNVMKFASHFPKWGKKILVKNLLWQVPKFWFQRGEGRLIFKEGYRQFLEENRTFHICSIINN